MQTPADNQLRKKTYRWYHVLPKQKMPSVQRIKRFLEKWKPLLFELRHRVAEDEWAIICPAGIGDTYLLSSLAESLLSEHGGRTCTIYTSAEQQFIPALFPALRHAALPSTWDVSWMRNRPFQKGRLSYGHFARKDITRLIGYKSITLLDCYRALLDLPQETRVSLPRKTTAQEVSGAEHFLIEHSAKPGKTALVFPKARSSSSLSDVQTELLCEQLADTGWDVLISSAGNDTAIREDFQRVSFPSPMLYALAEVAGKVVTVRSGIADLLSASSCQLSVLYPQDLNHNWNGGPLIAGTGLRAMKISPSAQEFEIEIKKPIPQDILLLISQTH